MYATMPYFYWLSSGKEGFEFDDSAQPKALLVFDLYIDPRG